MRHHRGEVERIDRRDHAQRMPFDPALDSPAHFQHLSHRQLRQRAGELGQFDGLEDLGFGLARQLAMLLGDQGRQVLDMTFEEGLVAEEDLDPFLDRGTGPASVSLTGRLDRGVDHPGIAQRYPGEH